MEGEYAQAFRLTEKRLKKYRPRSTKRGVAEIFFLTRIRLASMMPFVMKRLAIMKTYPSIPRLYDLQKYNNVKFHIFEKLDGSNIRVEWSKKSGFCKFGTRHQLLTEDQGPLYNCKQIITDMFEDSISSKLSRMKVERAVLFFEYYGVGSFAGSHPHDDTMTAALIDIDIYKKGTMSPQDFVNFCGDDLKCAKLLAELYPTKEFVDAVRDGSFDGCTFEGVIGKAKLGSNFTPVEMFKIKTQKWLDALKEHCGGNQELYERLK